MRAQILVSHSFTGGFGINALTFACGACLAVSASAQYSQTNLVSNGTIPAAHTDPNLLNSWGVAFNPTGFVWVGNNHSGTSTLYDGNGVPQSLVVTVPGVPATAQGNPTGVVFYGGSNFRVSDGINSAPSRFLFASEDGSISGWAPSIPPPPPSTTAHTAVDNSSRGAIYKGLAVGAAGGSDRLYATDFHNGAVNMFGPDFAELNDPGAFQDPTLPAGYAPFNIATLNGMVYVTYALQDDEGEDDVPGAGNGYINVFSPTGEFVSRFASNGALNAPWGMAVAPADFGAFSGDLLVGNFGDGRINAFDPATGEYRGALTDASGETISIEGLWGIQFGNGVSDQPTNTLFFAAGPEDETAGLYGRIDMVPEPTTIGMLGVGLLILTRRSSRS